MSLHIGLMSGTSLDGVDGVLAEFEGSTPPHVLAHRHLSMPASLAAEFLALNRRGDDELHRAAVAANGLARLYAAATAALLDAAALSAAQVASIGAHGQTVRHQPGGADANRRYTLQVQNPALLAELTGIDVVADFRSRDVAAGGQGAPLVPAFHRAAFASRDEDRAVVNLGGIANVTLLVADGTTTGFDCGPANTLLDLWCQRHTGRPYDDGGTWAASGRALPALLAALQQDAFFEKSPPKSTGRDHFDADWLAGHLGAPAAAPRDVQATLAELTAWCCAEAVKGVARPVATVLVCGGGAFNGDLMRRLARRLPASNVRPSGELGWPPQQVEATAFAWLAYRFGQRLPGNLVAVTGARGERVLGALYPA